MHGLANDIPAEDELNQVVHRYVDLVYAAAFRQMNRDANSAADITQGVMIVLVTKCRAGKLPEECRMAGWLLNVTRNTVLQFRRAAARRARHETRAVQSSQPDAAPSFDADLLAALDRAIVILGAVDSEVIARRYLQDQSLAEIGAAVGMNENTAGRRIARAIEKLRTLLEPRGVKAPATALIAVLGAEAAVKAPAACASLAAPGRASMELANQILWRMTMAKVSGLIVVALGALFLLYGVVTAVIESGGKQLAATSPSVVLPIAPQPRPITIEPAVVVDGPSDAILKEALTGLAENQKKLRSIHVVSSEVAAIYDPIKKRWLAPSHNQGEAWFDGATRRVRALVTHHQTRTINQNGLGDLQDESFVEAWDGTTLYRQYGPPDSAPAAETFPTRCLKGDALLGMDFSMQLAWDLETAQDASGLRTTVDRYPLDPATLSHMKLSARRVKLQGGIEAVELAIVIPDDKISRSETFWFDSHRGYALLARRDVLSIKSVEMRRMTRRIDQLAEPVPGVFYPAKAEMYWEQQGVPVAWSVFEAAKVSANEPLSDAFFKLEFPANIQITDFDKNGRGTKR